MCVILLLVNINNHGMCKNSHAYKYVLSFFCYVVIIRIAAPFQHSHTITMMANMQTIHTDILTSFMKVLSVIRGDSYIELVTFSLSCRRLVVLIFMHWDSDEFIEGFFA